MARFIKFCPKFMGQFYLLKISNNLIQLSVMHKMAWIGNLLYPFQYETPCISPNEKRPHQFLIIIFFLKFLFIVQGGKNMLGELAMDNLVIMSAFDSLMKVLEILLKEGVLFVNFWCSLLIPIVFNCKITSKQNWDIPLNFGFLN